MYILIENVEIHGKRIFQFFQQWLDEYYKLLVLVTNALNVNSSDVVRNLKEKEYQKTHNERKGYSLLVTTVAMCRTKRFDVKRRITDGR